MGILKVYLYYFLILNKRWNNLIDLNEFSEKRNSQINERYELYKWIKEREKYGAKYKFIILSSDNFRKADEKETKGKIKRLKAKWLFYDKVTKTIIDKNKNNLIIKNQVNSSVLINFWPNL